MAKLKFERTKPHQLTREAKIFLVPKAGIGPATSPLPRECSTTEPFGPTQTGAGEGDRTLVVSLENFCSTIELHPHALPLNWHANNS